MTDNDIERMVENTMNCRESLKSLLKHMGFVETMKDYDNLYNLCKLAYAIGASDTRRGLVKLGCVSTHCERHESCRSPHECSGNYPLEFSK